MEIGSQEHKELFCRSFIATHEAYDPTELPWPELDAQSLAFLRSVPVWSMALQVEQNAGVMITGFAARQADGLIQEALRLQAFEEERHGRMIRTFAERYALAASVGEPEAKPTRRAFVDFGYNECLDSFFGFGVFRIAEQVRIVPAALTSLFARVLWEEARHIVFFVNWIAYERSVRGYGWAPLQAFPAAIGYGRALLRSAGRARLSRTEDKGLEGVGDIIAGLTPAAFLRTCLRENAAYMARFDSRLIRPTLIPSIARVALGVLEAAERLRPGTRKALPGA